MGATGKHQSRGKSSASPVARRGGIKEGEGEDGIKGAMEKEDDFGVDQDKPVHRKLRSGRTVYAEVHQFCVPGAKCTFYAICDYTLSPRLSSSIISSH